MAKIAISYFHPTDLGSFIHNLNPSQCKTVLGGYMYFNLMNLTGGLNNIGNVYIASGYNDNKIYTVDYTRSIYNWFYL
jgi:hypothetical protein